MVAIAFGCGVFSKSLRNTNETFLYCKYHILYSSVSLVLSLSQSLTHSLTHTFTLMLTIFFNLSAQLIVSQCRCVDSINKNLNGSCDQFFDHVPTKFIFNANHLLLFLIRNYDCRGNKKKQQLKKSYTNLSKITVKH